MGNQEDKQRSGFINSLWRNWVNLDPEQRSRVATRLGPVGHVLSIAANVQQFANKVESQPSTQDTSSDNPDDSDADEDIIDVEFEEDNENG